MMGAERKSMAMTEEEKTLTAYHEGGHAILALVSALHRPGPQGDDHPPRPRPGHGDAAARGRPLLHEVPADDVSRLTILMGGRVAEEIDVRQGEHHLAAPRPTSTSATRLAKAMVTQAGAIPTPWASSAYGDNQDEVFLGMSHAAAPRPSATRPLRPSTAEVKRLVHGGLRGGQAHPHRTRRQDLETLAQGPAGVRDALGRRDHQGDPGHPARARDGRAAAASGRGVGPADARAEARRLPQRRGAAPGVTPPSLTPREGRERC